MWLWLAIGSAVLLGFYDIAKKIALQRNSTLVVLLVATALSSVILSPCLFIYRGSAMDHLTLLMKAVLVTASWVSGMIGLRMLPITICSTMKATRPFLVVVFSIILFGEQLNGWQWGGVILALAAVLLLSRTGRMEGINFARNKGIYAMALAICTGAASALFDKFIIKGMEPLFVQCWSNVYITLMLAVCICFKMRFDTTWKLGFKWDWTLLVIALLIVGADMLYFFSLKQDGALLSVISLARRASVIVTFSFGSLIFKENNVGAKAVSQLVLLAGMVLLLIGS